MVLSQSDWNSPFIGFQGHTGCYFSTIFIKLSELLLSSGFIPRIKKEQVFETDLFCFVLANCSAIKFHSTIREILWTKKKKSEEHRVDKVGFICFVSKLSAAHVILVPTDVHFRSCQHSVRNLSSSTERGIHVFTVTLHSKVLFSRSANQNLLAMC